MGSGEGEGLARENDMVTPIKFEGLYKNFR